MIAALFLLLFLLLALNVPVFMALILSSTAIITVFTDITPIIVLQRIFSGIDKFSLMAVPFFILTANVMNRGGLSPMILKFSNTLVGHKRGGLAFTVVLASMFLGAVSGSAPATVVAICSIMLPTMLESGYGKGFSVGLIMAASSIAVVIPPSIGMIVYGSVTGTSIGELFMAGFVPGIMIGLSYMLYSYFYAKKKNIPLSKKATPRERWVSLKSAGWALGIPFVIIGGIYSGYFTPTESAGIAAVYSIVISMWVYKNLSFKELIDAAYDSATGTAQIMVILAGASVFSWLLSRFQVPITLATMITDFAESKFVVLILINVVLLVAGMFLDPASIQTIMGPIFLPLATQFGVHPVHLGIIMVVNGAIGMFTPPFGLNLFVASGVTNIPLVYLIKKVWVWIIISLIMLMIITYFPFISMMLPNLLFR